MSFSERVVIGVYGVSGAGKSHALAKIAEDRIEWRCLEGSQIIEDALKECGKTMEQFQNEMATSDKSAMRQEAIKSIGNNCGVTVVAGHCSFPIGQAQDSTGSSVKFKDVFTPADGATYDAIFYLDRSSALVFSQRQNDPKRSRENLPLDVLQKWIDHEKTVLKAKCDEHNIFFDVLPCSDSDGCQDLIKRIVETTVAPAAEVAKLKSEQALRGAIKAEIPKSDVYLLIDGDRTICPQDTGTLFFDQIDAFGTGDPLKQIFKRYDDYTFQAFWEVAMLYGKIVPRPEYLRLSKLVGRESVHIYPVWMSFLSNIPSNVHPILVSCSNREVWQAMLAKATKNDGPNSSTGLNRISIIAGNNTSLHSYLVDDNAKAIVARELRKKVGDCRIFSFGDSALDEPMFRESDRAYIVVDDRLNRSMKTFFASVQKGGRHHWLYQLVGLDLDGPKGRWHDGISMGSFASLLEELKAGHCNRVHNYALSHASGLVLASQTRRADLHGLNLQMIHGDVGRFLADRMMDDYGLLMGLVCDTELPHVQGGVFAGKAAVDSNVLILPLMRGGEPMARGVYSRFPSALFVHFYDDEAEAARHDGLFANALKCFESNTTVSILVVDSVINSGKSIERAITRIHKLAKQMNSSLTVVIYVMAGVIQQEAAERLPLVYPRVRFLALRVSENKYIGKRGTDTGNRLFGTLSAG